MASKDTYKEPVIIKSENAIMRVYIPELTPEERTRRMNIIKAAAANLLKNA